MKQVCTLCLGESDKCSACNGTGELEVSEYRTKNKRDFRIYVLEKTGGCASLVLETQAHSAYEALRDASNGTAFKDERVSVQQLNKKHSEDGRMLEAEVRI